MPSRARRTVAPKRTAFRLERVVEGVARRLERAADAMETEIRKHSADTARKVQVAREQLQSKGRRFPDASSTGSALHLGVEHPHDVLCEHPRMLLERIRAVGVVLAELESSASSAGGAWMANPIRVRRKTGRKGRRIEIERSIKALASWASTNGLGEADTPVEYLPYVHLHLRGTSSATDCNEKPCKNLAVCRALHELVEARDSAMRVATRALAQASFDAGSEIAAIAQHVEPGGVPTLVVDEFKAIAKNARLLDAAIRERCLGIGDHAPRGRRSDDVVLLAVTRNLARGGFQPAEIAKLVHAGTGKTERAQIKNVRRRLQRRGAKDWRMRYSHTPDA